MGRQKKGKAEDVPVMWTMNTGLQKLQVITDMQSIQKE